MITKLKNLEHKEYQVPCNSSKQNSLLFHQSFHWRFSLSLLLVRPARHISHQVAQDTLLFLARDPLSDRFCFVKYPVEMQNLLPRLQHSASFLLTVLFASWLPPLLFSLVWQMEIHYLRNPSPNYQVCINASQAGGGGGEAGGLHGGWKAAAAATIALFRPGDATPVFLPPALCRLRLPHPLHLHISHQGKQ